MKVNCENISKKKHNAQKPFIIAILSLVSAVIITLLIILGWQDYKVHNPEGYNSFEVLATDFIDATYDRNIDAMIEMMPYEFREMLYENAGMLYGTNDTESVKLFSKGIDNHFLMLEAWSGTNWHLEYELGDYYQYTDEEIEEVKVMLTRCNINKRFKVDEYGLVNVDVHIVSDKNIAVYLDGEEPDKETIDFDVYVPVIKHGRYWYLGQYIGTPANKKAQNMFDMYGDLLDGFIINTNYDQYGHEVLYTDDGISAAWDPVREAYTYVDIYGNTHYCDAKLKDIEVIGPDGGVPLNEDTYAEWWASYYEAAEEAEHEHQEEFNN